VLITFVKIADVWDHDKILWISVVGEFWRDILRNMSA